MTGILITTVFTAIAFFAIWSFFINKNSDCELFENKYIAITITALSAFVLRLILSGAYSGHQTDMSCFTVWASEIFDKGISSFYSLDMFHDYPPGYMYVLYLIGGIKTLLSLSGNALYVLIKLPAVICDIITGLMVYKIAQKKFSTNVSTILCAVYIFNPAVILNSSLWGQVDSVFALFSVLMLYFITERKMILSYFMFALCIFIKPQAFILTPVVIFAILENVFIRNFDIKNMFKNIIGGLCAIFMIFILSMPFGLSDVINQYTSALSSYSYFTVNAFNLWGAFGKSWVPLNSVASFMGYVFIILITLYSAYVFFKTDDDAKYYSVGGLLVFLTYMFSTKMHERYAFPAMILFLLSFAASKDMRTYIAYSLVTLSQFFNTAWILFVYETDSSKYVNAPTTIVASIINIAITAFIIYSIQKNLIKKGNNINVKFMNKKSTRKITRTDIIVISVITLLYSFIALYDLGDMKAPKTDYIISNAPVTLNLGDEYEINEYKFYLGANHLNDNATLTVRFSNKNSSQTYSKTLTSGSVFHWDEIVCDSGPIKAQYVTLLSENSELSMFEFALFNADGEQLTPDIINPSAAEALFDEQELVPERSNFRNSTYFDEIYHARTAYEFLNGMTVYEWTHPPLGKIFISIGIKLFGMCPFGWRIIGTLFGILMVPLIYVFAKKLFKKTFFATVVCLLFTFDFMHFAQTRIATIDVYITFFVILMYFFMYLYYSTSPFKSFKSEKIILALCGTSMGLGIACKWTGIYAGAGLALIFAISLWNRYKLYCKDDMTNTFKPYLAKTLIWCVLWFIVVPLAIYCLSYIPYLSSPNSQGFKSIIDNQKDMFIYHSKTVLGAEHPFSSRWYEWIIMKRPIWYYSSEISSTIREGISSFGNPLVWWIGIPAFLYTIYQWGNQKSKIPTFLIISYLAQLVSWIPVTRLTFIYHYFPCVPFVVLMIVYSIQSIFNKAHNKKIVLYGTIIYTALTVGLFAMFYPVLSGQPCNIDYAKNILEWFNSWILL